MFILAYYFYVGTCRAAVVGVEGGDKKNIYKTKKAKTRTANQEHKNKINKTNIKQQNIKI